MLLSWAVYEGAQFSENVYVLEKGEYATTEAMGLASAATLRSVQHIGHVSTGAVLQGGGHVTCHQQPVLFLSRSSPCPPSSCSARSTSEVED